MSGLLSYIRVEEVKGLYIVEDAQNMQYMVGNYNWAADPKLVLCLVIYSERL